MVEKQNRPLSCTNAPSDQSQEFRTHQVYHCRILIRRVDNFQHKLHFKYPNMNKGYLYNRVSYQLSWFITKSSMFLNFSIFGQLSDISVFHDFGILISRRNANSWKISTFGFQWFSIKNQILKFLFTILKILKQTRNILNFLWVLYMPSGLPSFGEIHL